MNRSRAVIKPFTQVINSLLNDTELSLKAKGLYAYMDSKPDGWNFTIISMSKQLLEGTDAIKSGLRELKNKGYLEYTKKIDGYGEYTLTDGIAPKVDNPHVENPKKGKPTRINNKEPIVIKIIHCLNDKASKRFKSTAKTKSLINARLNEGFTEEDFYTVIEVKCNEWLSDKDMNQYLRPETLFGTKFEGYLNQETKKEVGGFDYARYNKWI